MSDWHNEWPAKGLLQECRKLWVERDVLRARIAELEENLTDSQTRETETVKKLETVLVRLKVGNGGTQTF